MITIDGDGWACDDCAQLIAYAETSPDYPETELAEWLARVESRLTGIHAVIGEDYDSFSMTPCDVCGANIGSARRMVYFLAR